MGDSDLPSTHPLLGKWYGGRFWPTPPHGDCWMCWEKEELVQGEFRFNNTCKKCHGTYFKMPFEEPVDHHIENLILWRDSGYWMAMPFPEFVEKLGGAHNNKVVRPNP